MHSFTVDGLMHPLRVVRFAGREALSQPFQIEIAVTSEEHDLASSRLVGRRAVLAIDVDGELGEPRPIHGVIGRFAHGDSGRAPVTMGPQAAPNPARWRAQSEYLVTLVPATSRMRLRTDSRIFQGLTVPEILADVFERAGFERTRDGGDPRSRAVGAGRSERPGRAELPASGYRMALTGVHRARENCVQYRESDWDFASRLMEEEGLHYFFEHDASSHVLVISDTPAEHAPIAAGLRGGDVIPYRPAGGAMSAGEHVSRFHFAEEARPARVVVSDYSFERPRLPLLAAAEVPGAAPGAPSPFEVFEHPGDYDLPEAGRALSQVRLEELQASRWTGDGDSDSVRLAPGRTFVLAEHPSAELNRGYLITSVEHRWIEGDPALNQYRCRFEVTPADVAFRPPRRTPRPIVHGIQTAIVVGPPGEEIHTDAHGRVKVRFHWDRSGRDDDRCSCWIRVAQASAGAAWGSLFLPRVGHEVVVDFLEGDPDRPLVTGSVYHGANVPPYALPGDKTKSTLKTQSSPGGGGSNELRFEDKAGGEEVYLHAQKDLTIEVEHHKDQKVGGHETLSVDRNRTVHVKGAHTETVLLAQTTTVGLALTQTVGAVMTTAVAGAKIEMVGVNSSEMVVGKKSVKAGLDHRVSAGKSASTKAVRDVTVDAGQNVAVTSGKDMGLSSGRKLSATATASIDVLAGDGMSVTVTGDHDEDASKNRTLVVGEKLTIQCGSSTITMSKDGKIVISGADVTITSPDKPVKIDGKEIHVKADGPVSLQASGKVQIKGKAVGLN
jgi:type VI secretion system secreted protein VgrG